MIIITKVNKDNLEAAQQILTQLATVQPTKDGVYHTHVIIATALPLNTDCVSHLLETSYGKDDITNDVDTYYLARAAASPTHVTFIFRAASKADSYADNAVERLNALWARCRVAFTDEVAAAMINSLDAQSTIYVSDIDADYCNFVNSIQGCRTYTPPSCECKSYHDMAFGKNSEYSIADQLHLDLHQPAKKNVVLNAAWAANHVNNSVKEED